ncbi:MAG: elongation factor 1-beta [Candidatus Woesearchaeota archaeon]
MADVVVTLNIMPETPDSDLSRIEKESLALIKKFAGIDNHKTEIKPVAFGLKMISIMFVMPESKGSTEELEEKIKNINEVSNVEVADVRRTVG